MDCVDREARRPERVDGTRLDTEPDLELSELFGIAAPVLQRLTDREVDHAHRTLKDILENGNQQEKVKELPAHRHHQKAAR